MKIDNKTISEIFEGLSLSRTESSFINGGESDNVPTGQHSSSSTMEELKKKKKCKPECVYTCSSTGCNSTSLIWN